MATLDQIDFRNMFTMLKGEPGTRKSSQALTYPKPQYWVSTDLKMEALALPARKFNINLKEVEYDNFHDWNKPQAKLESFRLNCKFKSIVVDSITSIGDNINRQTLAIKNKDKDGYKIAGIPVNTMEDYKAETSALQDLIGILKDVAGYHHIQVILIAHVVGVRKQDPDNNLTNYSRIIVTGSEKMAVKIPAYCTEVYHFNPKPNPDPMKGPDYSIITSHTGNDFARTALELPKTIEFNEKPLYDTWIKPAIIKMQPDFETRK